MVEVADKTLDDHGGQLDLPHDRVAAPAQQAPHTAGHMAMVDDEHAVNRVAQETPVALPGSQLIDLGRRQPVLAHQPSAQVLRASGSWIASPPLAQSLVPTLAVGGPVLAVPPARTAATLAPLPTPVRKRFVGLIDAANLAFHPQQPSAVAWHGSKLDQPCHADVLLELANPG